MSLMKTDWIFVAGALALLTACSVGPDYVRPTVVSPPVFKEMSGWKVAQPQDHISRGKWWELYGDPTLSGLAEQVTVSNQNLALAEAKFRQARALVHSARAAYFPTITAGASFLRSLKSSNVSGSTPASKTASPTSDFLIPVNITWEPDVWGRVRRTVEAGRAGAQASAADLEAVRLTLQSELVQDYFQLRTLDAQKKLLDMTADAFRKSLELTNNRYASGVASRLDVLLAETQLRNTEAQSIDTCVQRAQLEHAIATLIGKPASVFSIPFMPLDALPPDVPVGLPSGLLERRPDIAAAERRIAASNAQIGAAEAAYYPTITLTASAGFEASDISHWLLWPNRFWSFGPSITETLYDGGLRGAQTEQARAVYDGSVASYRQAVLTGFQEVEDNLAALRILEREAQVQGEAVKSAQQSVVVTTNQYKAGTADYLAVIVTQAAALSLERTAIDIVGRRMTASVLLIKALGGGWDASALPPPDKLDSYAAGKGP